MGFFFFFQAEDGIRGATVTGVQTCALPISPRSGGVGGRGVHRVAVCGRGAGQGGRGRPSGGAGGDRGGAWPKRRAKTDRADACHLRELLAAGRLPQGWIPPAHVLECRALLETYHALRVEHTAWV